MDEIRQNILREQEARKARLSAMLNTSFDENEKKNDKEDEIEKEVKKSESDEFNRLILNCFDEELFEKAKHQIGDSHPKWPQFKWTDLGGGKFGWRTGTGRGRRASTSNSGGTASSSNTSNGGNIGSNSSQASQTSQAKPDKKETTVDTLKLKSKNGFKFKSNSNYRMRYNKREKAYEIWKEGDIYGTKTAMMSIKSDNENIGDDIIKHIQKKYPKTGSTISYSSVTYGF